MVGSPRHQSIWVFVVYGVMGLLFIATLFTPFFMPCFLMIFFNLPCPACGLTRAFVAASQFNCAGAMRYNILFLPVVALGAILFTCAVVDFITNKGVILRFNLICKKKWLIATAIILLLFSWGHNIINHIQ